MYDSIQAFDILRSNHKRSAATKASSEQRATNLRSNARPVTSEGAACVCHSGQPQQFPWTRSQHQHATSEAASRRKRSGSLALSGLWAVHCAGLSGTKSEHGKRQRHVMTHGNSFSPVEPEAIRRGCRRQA